MARRSWASMSPMSMQSPSASARLALRSPPFFLLPSYYVNPRVGEAYVLVAFTVVVFGGMGSVPGALIGGLVIGVIESLTGLFFGESLGQLGIFVLFIVMLFLRPTGLFGARA